jgi:WD40 repeat protein
MKPVHYFLRWLVLIGLLVVLPLHKPLFAQGRAGSLRLRIGLGELRAMAWLSQKQWLVVGTSSMLLVYAYTDPNQLTLIAEQPLSGLNNLVVDFSEQWLALVITGQAETTIQIWELLGLHIKTQFTLPSIRSAERVPLAWQGDTLAIGGFNQVDCFSLAGNKRHTYGEYDPQKPVVALAWQPNSTNLVSATLNDLRLWSMQNGDSAQMLALTANALAFDAVGNRLAIGLPDGNVHEYAMSTKSLSGPVATHESTITDLAWHGGLLATASASAVQLWDSQTQKQKSTLPNHALNTLLAWASDGQMLITLSSYDAIRFWDTASNQVLTALESSIDQLLALAWHKDGKRFVVATSTGAIQEISLDSGKVRQLNDTANRPIRALAWDADGGQIIAAAGEITVWDDQQGRIIHQLGQASQNATTLALNQAAGLLASAHQDGSLRLWQWPSRQLLMTLGNAVTATASKPASISELDWNRSGEMIALRRNDGRIEVWHPNTQKLIQELVGPYTSLAWHSTKPNVLLLGGQRGLETWAIGAGAPETRTLAEVGIVKLQAQPTTDQLAYVEAGGLKLLTPDGSALSVAESAGPIGLVKWSPQGDLLAVISDQSIIRVYEIPVLKPAQ